VLLLLASGFGFWLAVVASGIHAVRAVLLCVGAGLELTEEPIASAFCDNVIRFKSHACRQVLNDPDAQEVYQSSVGGKPPIFMVPPGEHLTLESLQKQRRVEVEDFELVECEDLPGWLRLHALETYAFRHKSLSIHRKWNFEGAWFADTRALVHNPGPAHIKLLAP
jgi:hypothetical protein